MGTWAPGPFGNDAASDLAGRMVDLLMVPVDAFLGSPDHDGSFEQAFAAVALLNEVMSRTAVRPWDETLQAPRPSKPIVDALISVFDEHYIDEDTADTFARSQRAALLAECERFSSFLD